MAEASLLLLVAAGLLSATGPAAAAVLEVIAIQVGEPAVNSTLDVDGQVNFVFYFNRTAGGQVCSQPASKSLMTH